MTYPIVFNPPQVPPTEVASVIPCHDGSNKWLCAITGSADYFLSVDGGRTFQQHEFPAAHDWQCVLYGGGVWVAVSGTNNEDNVVFYSYDALNWSIVGLSTSGLWYGHNYVNNRFVIVDYQGNNGQTSPDGVNWTQFLPNTARSRAVGFIGGNYTIGTDTFDQMYYSPDLIHWSAATGNLDPQYRSPAVYNGIMCAGSIANAGTFFTTTDGTHWTRHATSNTDEHLTIVADPSIGGFLTMPYNGGTIPLQSTDGVHWVENLFALPQADYWNFDVNQLGQVLTYSTLNGHYQLGLADNPVFTKIGNLSNFSRLF